MMPKLTFTISARRVAQILAVISAYLCLQSIVAKHIEAAAGTNSTYWIYHFVRLVNVNQEANIPTWYASTLLLACAALVAVTAYAVKTNKGRFVGHWFALSAIFLYLAVDEAAALHEKLTIPLQEALNPTGVFYFAWVFVGAAALAVFVLAYLPFFFHLPAGTRKLFLLAGLLYVGGALGVEAISANQWYLDEGSSLTYAAIGTVEELLEMLGVVVLIYALIKYLSACVDGIHIALSARPAPANLGNGETANREPEG